MSDFVITTAGLAAASVATPTGPYVEVVSFKLGSDTSTAATIGDTALVGSVVYTGTIASYSYYDSQTIQINMEVPATAGPFNYGEIGIFLTGGALFARFSYGGTRVKTSSTISGYANTLRIKALLRLSQGPAVFNFASGTPQTILEITDLSLLQTPADHPANPVVIVHEPSDYQDSLMLHKHTATLWTPENYSKVGTTVVSAAPDSTHLTAPLFASMLAAVSGNRGKYIFQTPGGYFRSIVSISGSTALLGSSIATGPLVGQTLAIYELDAVRIAELEAALVAATTSQFVPLAGLVTMTGQYNLSANAASALQPVPLRQLQGGLTANITADAQSVVLGTTIIKRGTTGTLPLDSTGNVVTFLTAFPTACDQVIATPSTNNSAGAGSQYSWGIYGKSTTQFSINNDASASVFDWIAIGH